MKRVALSALLSHWRRKPFQCLTLVMGLALATALWSGVQAINSEARAAYNDAARALGGFTQTLTPKDGGGISQADYVALRRAGWIVSPVIEGTLVLPQARVRIIGLDPLTAPAQSKAAQSALEGDVKAFFTQPGRIFATPETAERLHGADLPPVLGIEGLAPGIIFADIGIAQALLNKPGQISKLVLHDIQPLTQAPLDQIAPNLALQQNSGQSDLSRLTDSFHLNLTAFGLLSFAVGLFIVQSAIGLAFEQRRPMFRTMRALGVSARMLIWLLVAELLVFAVLAGGLGTALGYLIASALLPDVVATLSGLYGASVEGGLSFRPVWWLSSMAIAIAGTGLAAGGVLWKMARMPVLAPAKPRAWAQASERVLIWQGGAALGLICIAIGGGIFGTGLIMGFVTLAALLLAAALSLPLFLRCVISIVERYAKGALAQWFWADTRQQISGLSLALMALLLALATNIGVGTMVSSFRLTFTGWLDQRLVAELYVRAETPAQYQAMTNWLSPRVEAILPVVNVETQIAGYPAEIYGQRDHVTYRNNWPLLAAYPDVWDRVADGSGVLINEQLSLRENLSPGDTLNLAPDWQPQITGVYSDYGNPKAQAIISLDQLRGRFPDAQLLRFAVRMDPAQADALATKLTQRFDLNPENVTNQDAIKAFSLQVFERTFTVSAALNVLTLSVAGFAILTSLLTLAAMRLPQLAPVWAAGLPHKSLAKLELVRALLLAALTLVVALPLGLGLAWVLLNIVNVEAFGWRLPMFLFPVDWLTLGLLALFAAGAASLWPAIRLARMPPSSLLKVFANER